MRMVDIISKKKAGGALSDAEIRYFVENFTAGTIPDYQASALCMAICFQGMTKEETVCLTKAMAGSGETLDLSALGVLSADKHSTGGVGDKTSLIVAPIVASLGGKMAKLSGRGLGHTGGTVDKLEAIPGMKTALPADRFIQQANEVGIALIGQTQNITPADKKLYALRDVTATVESIPLIVSSIMSKKLAAGSQNIVLDVKVGNGAFMKTEEDARELATQMVAIGKACGRNTAALLTNMDAPLGHYIGNSLEVYEAVQVLKGNQQGDLLTVCKNLAATLASLVFGWTKEEAKTRVDAALSSGAAFAKMKEWIAAQGGDIAYIDHPDRLLTAKTVVEVPSPADGYVCSIKAMDIGLVATKLGAGRATKEDTIDYAAGICIHKKVGDAVKKGEPLFTLYTDRPETAEEAKDAVLRAYDISAFKPTEKPLILDIIR